MKIPLKIKYKGKESVVLVNGIDPVFAQCAMKYLLAPLKGKCFDGSRFIESDPELIELNKKVEQFLLESEKKENAIAYYIEQIDKLGDKKRAEYLFEKFLKLKEEDNKISNIFNEFKKDPEKAMRLSEENERSDKKGVIHLSHEICRLNKNNKKG